MIGSREDIEVRLRRLLPASWFGTDHPILSALLLGLGDALASVFALIEFARLQTRIATATDGWLDMAAQDFFGRALPRFDGEPDSEYRLRLRREVFRRRNTRQALKDAVRDLTGHDPELYEPFYPLDCGGWGLPVWGWGVEGAWGSSGAPYEVIVTMPLPPGYGIPDRGGWGTEVGGWGIGNFSFVGPEDFQGRARIADILRALDGVRAAGVTIFARFTSLGSD